MDEAKTILNVKCLSAGLCGGLSFELEKPTKNIFIWSLKTWSFGPGQSSLALPEESLQKFEVS